MCMIDNDRLELAARVIQKVSTHPEGSGLVMKLNLEIYQYGNVLPEESPLATKLYTNAFQTYHAVKSFVERQKPKVAEALVYEKDFIDALAMFMLDK